MAGKLLLVLLLGCSPSQPVDSATPAALPGHVTVRLAPCDDITFDRATLDSYTLYLHRQDAPVAEQVEVAPDLVTGPRFEPPALPEGPITQLEIRLAGYLQIIGTTTADELVAIKVNPPDDLLFDLATPLDPKSGGLVVELGRPGWLDQEELGWLLSQPLLILPNDSEEAPIADSIRFQSALFHDPNQDGHLDDKERKQGALARPSALTRR